MDKKHFAALYLRHLWKRLLPAVGICLAYNLYFGLLLQAHEWHFLTYLNVLILVMALLGLRADYKGYRRRMEQEEAAAAQTEALQEQVRQSYAAGCDLQDYITKWCHEVKIPLAAAMLLAEKLEEGPEKENLRQQLERINSQLKNALLGCKVQGSLFDIKARSVRLGDCVRESIRNNQFFLIHGNFEIQVSGCEESVYTDKGWLVYVLDQLISNAIKYAKGEPVLKLWTEQRENTVALYVEDNGKGIAESDIRRIFEKGYTGQGHGNGQYKSTGMGLYMVSVILEKLEHGISVESAEGQFTRFCLSFADEREYFFRN